METSLVVRIQELLDAGELRVKLVRDAEFGGISYHDAVLEREDDQSLTLVVNLDKGD